MDTKKLTEARRVLKILPYSFYLDLAKFTRLRTEYKIKLANSLLESSLFEEVKNQYQSEILTALLFHDCWEHDGVIVDQYNELHAYSGSREIRNLASYSKSEFLNTVADIIETHEGSSLLNINHPHLLAIPSTIPQKFVYHIVQAIDTYLVPMLAGELYQVSENSDRKSDKDIFTCFRKKFEELIKH